MPVLDHPIHDKVKHDKPPAGCKDRVQIADGYYVLVRSYIHDGRYEFKDQWIPHTMSTQCRQIANLPECEGCTAEKDVEYIEMMRKLEKPESEVDMLRDYIAKHNEFYDKAMLELAVYQAKEGKLGTINRKIK